MKNYLVISPKTLKKPLISESKRLMQKVYGKKVNGIYYGIKTKQKLKNPRRLFIKGNGRIIETEIKPHISLIHNIQLKNTKNFTKKAKNICKKYKPIKLKFTGTGNYNMNFTFFVKFTCSPALKKLRKDLLKLSKPFMSKEEYNQHIKAKFIPHATVLYDDVKPKKILKAYKLLNKEKFNKSLLAKEILLWKIGLNGQKTIAKFSLEK